MFDYAHPATIKATFSFLKYVLACKNSARFIHSSKLESHALLTTAIQKLLKYIVLNLLEFASA